jgi:GGDEF domain-containing protein
MKGEAGHKGAMISIQKEIRTGEGLLRLLERTMLCFQGTVEDARRYAIDFGPPTRVYQAALDDIIETTAKQEWSAHQVEQLRSRVQTAFRSYQQKAEQQLCRLRSDFEQTATSLAAVLKSLEYEDPALSLRAQVKQLADLQKIDDVAELKASLQAALGKLEDSLNQMEKRERLVISDLQAEISTLHNRVAILAPAREGPRNLRLILDERLSGDSFTLLVVRLNGLTRVRNTHGDVCANAVLTEAQERLKSAIAHMQAVGLWDDQTIGAITAADATAAVLTHAANTALTGKYHAEGRELALRASAGLVAWRPSDDRERFLRRLQDLVQVLPN